MLSTVAKHTLRLKHASEDLPPSQSQKREEGDGERVNEEQDDLSPNQSQRLEKTISNEERQQLGEGDPQIKLMKLKVQVEKMKIEGRIWKKKSAKEKREEEQEVRKAQKEKTQNTQGEGRQEVRKEGGKIKKGIDECKNDEVEDGRFFELFCYIIMLKMLDNVSKQNLHTKFRKTTTIFGIAKLNFKYFDKSI